MAEYTLAGREGNMLLLKKVVEPPDRADITGIVCYVHVACQFVACVMGDSKHPNKCTVYSGTGEDADMWVVQEPSAVVAEQVIEGTVFAAAGRDNKS